jgi:hypothetical protein
MSKRYRKDQFREEKAYTVKYTEIRDKDDKFREEKAKYLLGIWGCRLGGKLRNQGTDLSCNMFFA